MPHIRGPFELQNIRRAESLIWGRWPDTKFVSLLQNEFEGLLPFEIWEAFTGCSAQLPLPVPPTPDKSLLPRIISANHDGPFKGTSVLRFNLGSWHITPDSSDWNNALVKCAGVLSIEHPTDFWEIVAPIRGERRQYFSEYAKLLEKPEPIFGSSLFVETNLSSNNHAELITELSRLFGYPEPQFEVS